MNRLMQETFFLDLVFFFVYRKSNGQHVSCLSLVYSLAFGNKALVLTMGPEGEYSKPKV